MTRASDHEDHAEPVRRRLRPRLSHPVKSMAAMAVLFLLAVLPAACGGSGPNDTDHASKTSSSGVIAESVAYSHCMRSHGVPDFPDPTFGPGGGVTFQFNGGQGSDLNHNNPTFEAADEACRSLLPGREQAPPVPAQKIAAEVKWAGCMRSHGLPGFPDPNAQGAFDSSRFNDSSPTFQRASQACKLLEPTGPISAVPGHGSGS